MFGDSVIIRAEKSDGFDVRFESDADGCNVGYDHWLELSGKQNADRTVACFVEGLNGSIRSHVHARGSVDYPWLAEGFENGRWGPVSATWRVRFPFWRSRATRTLRNSPIA